MAQPPGATARVPLGTPKQMLAPAVNIDSLTAHLAGVRFSPRCSFGLRFGQAGAYGYFPGLPETARLEACSVGVQVSRLVRRCAESSGGYKVLEVIHE